MRHYPVMLDEVIALLGIYKDGLIIDGTIGDGGHTAAILEKMPQQIKVIGIERDRTMFRRAQKRLASYKDRLTILHTSYSDFTRIQQEVGDEPIRGFLLDLGVSSIHLDSMERGFSFRDTHSLDMRFNPEEESQSAADVVNTFDEKALADIFYQFGEIRGSRRIARGIVEHRKEELFCTGEQLAKCIAKTTRSKSKEHLHPATQAFQALRIYVNDELQHLKFGLETAKKLLAPGGRLIVIAFHSLEDRIVKQFLKRESGKCVCPSDFPQCVCHPVQLFKILTKHVIRPNDSEIASNPRSRSARLRCAQRTAEVPHG